MNWRKILNTKRTALTIGAVVLVIILAFPTGKLTVTSGHHAKVVALTFDDGPDPRFTPKILKILKKDHVRATFFMVGSQVNKYPRLTRQVANRGNEIGNHSYTHPNIRLDRRNQIKNEIKGCRVAIYRATGQKTHLFRPPYGLFNNAALAVAKQDGYSVVLWDVCVEHKAARTAGNEAKRVLLLVRPGYIILAHDGRLNREKTVRAIPLIINGLKEKGYKFVTVDELVKMHAMRLSQIKATALIIR